MPLKLMLIYVFHIPYGLRIHQYENLHHPHHHRHQQYWLFYVLLTLSQQMWVTHAFCGTFQF